jgi:hypothetical protein
MTCGAEAALVRRSPSQLPTLSGQRAGLLRCLLVANTASLPRVRRRPGFVVAWVFPAAALLAACVRHEQSPVRRQRRDRDSQSKRHSAGVDGN